MKLGKFTTRYIEYVCAVPAVFNGAFLVAILGVTSQVAEELFDANVCLGVDEVRVLLEVVK